MAFPRSRAGDLDRVPGACSRSERGTQAATARGPGCPRSALRRLCARHARGDAEATRAPAEASCRSYSLVAR
jgi:hypothetical protein